MMLNNNFLTSQCLSQNPTIRAVLGGFGSATDNRSVSPEEDDITQFGQLFIAMTSKCERQ